MELQPEAADISSASVIISTNVSYNEVEPIVPMNFIATKFEKIC